MPLKLDEDKAGGFDLATATTQFWKSIPILLRQGEREDQVENLMIRILSGVTRQNHNLRILRIYISSSEDHFFLHTLEVSEEDFQGLKVEQGILVDFSSFPAKIISLLEKCLVYTQSEPPRFQAVLTVRQAESVFKVVETNDFKQLAHITLCFRPGNDHSVKQFLAFRLMEVIAECETRKQEQGRTKEHQHRVEGCLSDTQTQLQTLKEQHARHLLETHANSKNQQAALQEEKFKDITRMKEEWEREKLDAEKRFQKHSDALNTRVQDLDVENRKLREHKYTLDSRVSELSHKVGSIEGANRSLQDDLTELRAQHKQLSREKHESDIALNDAKARLMAFDEKVQNQGEVVDQQKARIRDLEAVIQQWESRCKDLKSDVAFHEQRASQGVAEVSKGNQIIEKLTSDLRISKEKVKRKQAIIARQEEEIYQRDKSLSALQMEGQTSGRELEGLVQEHEALKKEAQELKLKLEDSKSQLQSNEQMIRWLNQQVTEAQIHSVGAVPGSRFTFRPSVASSISGPALGATTLRRFAGTDTTNVLQKSYPGPNTFTPNSATLKNTVENTPPASSASLVKSPASG